MVTSYNKSYFGQREMTCMIFDLLNCVWPECVISQCSNHCQSSWSTALDDDDVTHALGATSEVFSDKCVNV